jgi:DNA-binding NarL/FixJ family response regulator
MAELNLYERLRLDEGEASQPLVVLDAPRPPNDMVGNVRVMVVDDNPRTRRAVVACLSTLDDMSVVVEASSGVEALDALEHETPDVVLMDVRMPGMGGIEATRIIKHRWPQIKVIILSMYSDYLVDATLAGADAFLNKGCSVEELTAAIRALAAV